ncbi:MAG: ribose 5-phosphate isomerase B [Deltaproteobacteria bacterium]|nr:ribose 5-phosphate isomerase B [Deltaproteobacteria bacterium]
MAENRTPIVMGSDHAAYALKEKIKAFLIGRSVDVEDVGCYSEDSVDYSDIGIKVASMVSSGKYEQGILMCGTGIGMSMVANKFPHVRAALCADIFSAIMSRRHNNANILVLGGRVIGDILAMEIVKVWLETPFDGGRHQRRLEKFDQINMVSRLTR